MENQQSDSGTNTMLIVIVIILLLVGGFIWWEKTQNTNKPIQIEIGLGDQDSSGQ